MLEIKEQSYPSKIAYHNGIKFAFLFVLPQVISFIWVPYNILNPFWLVYFLFITCFAIRHYDNLRKRDMRLPLVLFAVICIGSVLTMFVGIPIGGVILKISIAFIGFVGYGYLSHNKIDPRFFNYVFPLLYIFFFIVYFRYDAFHRQSLDGDLFGHSSSNTISMVLTNVWFFYYIISKVEKRNNNLPLFFFSVINLFLIVVQGSRGGIVVATIEFMLLLSSSMPHNNTILFIIFMGLGIILFGKYGFYLEDIIEVEGMQGVDSFEDNTRSLAQAAFFSKMNTTFFIFGFPPNAEFGFETRTFNAFLDFWSRFGIFPFLLVIVLSLRRVLCCRSFVVSLFDFVPWFFYSLVESLWGGSLWDILLYIFLFYSYKSNICIHDRKNSESI